MATRLDRCSGGKVTVLLPPGELERVGGRCDIQSCTSNDTFGLDCRLSVFCEEGGVVMIMVGEFEKGVDGR
jgi:hypothetical protein